MSPRKATVSVVLAICLVSVSLIGCGATATPTAAPTAAATLAPSQPAPTAAPTKAPATATSVPPTPAAKVPAVGGSVVWALADEPDTLDVHKTGMQAVSYVMQNVGATLIAQDPATGKFVPYLAESWKVADDGLSIEFKLRKDVKFHDGTALTAGDYAWSLKRIIDPATKSPLASLYSSVADATATDDYTLLLKLKNISFALLLNLSSRFTAQPLPKAAVEKAAEQWGRAPLGVGPYKFKQWITGDRVVLERNPDYKWGPAFLKGGPYIQTITFRVLPEVATRMAGIEAGEVDYAVVTAKDYDRIKATGKVTIMQYVQPGGSPSLLFNAGKAPFDDVKVRQAFLYAVDRASLIKAVILGMGVEQHLPASPTMRGWWADGEKLGYNLDLAKAKDLMKQAGYTAGADGVLQKDGQPLKLVIDTGVDSKLAEVLIQQFKALGASVTIQSREWGLVLKDVFAGNFSVCTFSYLSTDFDLLVGGWGSKAMGGIDLPKANDAALDALLKATQTTLDPDKRQLACQEAQKYILDKALIGPLYAANVFWAVSNRVKNLTLSPVTTEVWWETAYIETK